MWAKKPAQSIRIEPRWPGGLAVLADANITVSTVCPGGVHTPMVEAMTTAEYRTSAIKGVIPLGHFGRRRMVDMKTARAARQKS